MVGLFYFWFFRFCIQNNIVIFISQKPFTYITILLDMYTPNIKAVIVFLSIFISSASFAQVQSRKLSESEAKQFCEDKIKNSFTFRRYNIDMAYAYSDISGNYCLLFMKESYRNDSIGGDFCNKIYIANYQSFGAQDFFTLDSGIQDLIDWGIGEYDIQYIPHQTYIEDIDGDQVMEAIYAYRLISSQKNVGDRLKIVLQKNKEKYGIRIKCVGSESKRIMHIDAALYKLPVSIVNKVYSILEQLEETGECSLPQNWRESFRKRKSIIW